MQKRERAKILKRLVLPDIYIKKDNLAYYLLKNKEGFVIMVAILLTAQSYKERFYVEYFIQPLFYPLSFYTFAIGRRLKYQEVDKLSEIEKELNSFKIFSSFEEVAEFILTEFHQTGPDFKMECQALIYFILERYEECEQHASTILAHCLEEYDKWPEPKPKHDLDCINLWKDFLSLFKDKKYDMCKKMIHDWQDFTLKSVKMTI